MFTFHSRRYYDKEPPKSPIRTPPAPSSAASGGPTIDKKAINLNLKPNVKVSAARTNSSGSIGGTTGNKRIDLGAASTYGKNDLSINSPTHRNTHSEDLIGVGDLIHGNDDHQPPIETGIDAVAADNDDDFNPRADEFGDFASAATGGGLTTNSAAVTNGKTVADEFADFASFPAAPKSTEISQKPVTLMGTDLLSDLGSGGAGYSSGPDLFSSLGAPSMPPAQVTPMVGNSGDTADLLSDFGNLALGGTNGELAYFYNDFTAC